MVQKKLEVHDDPAKDEPIQPGTDIGQSPKKKRLKRGNSFPYAFVSIPLGLIIWEALVWLFEPNPLVIVGPVEIFQQLARLFISGDIIPHFSVSMFSFAAGYGLAAAVTIPLGLVIGASGILYRWTDAWISALYATPIIGLAPLFIITLGFGWESKVAVVMLLSGFPILINTVSGARAVSVEQRELAKVYRANRMEAFVRVLLPGSVPFVLTGLRLAIGRGLIALIVADLFGASAGLGLRLQRAAQSFDTPSIFAITVLLAFMGILLTAAVQFVERKAYKGAHA